MGARPPELVDFAERARLEGVTSLSFTVAGGLVSGVTRHDDGIVIDLFANVVSVVQRNSEGTTLVCSPNNVS